jgi:hypothetical protein
MAQPSDATLARLRGPLPEGFERWVVALAPGETRPSGAAEWSGALALVEAGEIEVGCVIGATRTFSSGSLLALSCLPLAWLRNMGSGEARIVVVRRSRIGSEP